jgi:hypothetical protein
MGLTASARTFLPFPVEFSSLQEYNEHKALHEIETAFSAHFSAHRFLPRFLEVR